MLPTSGGFDSAGGARGGAAGILGSVARSEEVPGVARKVRSYLEASLAARDWDSDFWVLIVIFWLSSATWLSGCLGITLVIHGGLRERMVGREGV